MRTGLVRLSVVVPAYNEAPRITRTLDELRQQLPHLISDWEVRVVDDGSRDETARLVGEVAATDPRVVLQREPHRGKGGAVRAGLLAAPGELRFICDADLSMPVPELRRFLEAVPHACDIAIGSREGPSARRVGEPPYRHVMGRGFNAFVRIMAVPGIRDTQCGFKLLTAEAVTAICPLMTIDGWAFDIEMLLIARRLGLRVREVPIEWHYREHSQVSPVRDSFRMARDVLRIRANALAGAYGRRTQT